MAISDQQIFDFFLGNPTDAQTFEAMKTFGISPQRIATATGTKVEDIIPRLAPFLPQNQAILFGDTWVQASYRMTGSGESQEIGPLENIYISQTTGGVNDKQPVGTPVQVYSPEGRLVNTIKTKKDQSFFGGLVDALKDPVVLAALGGAAAGGLLSGAGTAATVGSTGLTTAQLAQLDLALGGAGGSAGASSLAGALTTGANVGTLTNLTGGSGVTTGTQAGITAQSVADKLAADAAAQAQAKIAADAIAADAAAQAKIAADAAAKANLATKAAADAAAAKASADAAIAKATADAAAASKAAADIAAAKAAADATALASTTGLGSSLGTGLTAGSAGLGLNAAGTAGLGAAGTGAGITAGTGLGTGVLSGSTLGTGLLGTAAGAAGLTGTGILAGSTLGTGLLGTTGTGALTGTGVLTGSGLGTQLLGTGAGTAATVGGLGNTVANLGTGALTTGLEGLSAGLTGLGTGLTSGLTGLGTGIGTGLTNAALANLLSGGLATAGSLLQMQQSKEAALAAQQRIDAETAAAKTAAQFRPIGMTTRFGTSQFQVDPVTGQLTSAGYTLSPEAKNAQDRLVKLAEQGLVQAEGAQAQFAPLQTGAQSLFNLGNQYLAQSPEDVAKNYLAQQMQLLQPGRELELANLQNKLQQQGRGGLSVAQGGALGATTPELQALYNARVMQEAQLAAQAQQAGQQQVTFGAGLLGQGSQAMGQYYGGQQAAYTPYTTALGQVQGLETAAQQPFTMGTNLAQQTSTAGANVGKLGLTGAQLSTNLATSANATANPYAQALMAAGNPNAMFGQALGNVFGGLFS
jgi:hypothetical protein